METEHRTTPGIGACRRDRAASPAGVHHTHTNLAELLPQPGYSGEGDSIGRADRA